MKNKKGFTLVELLAVIILIAVVALIGTSSLSGVRKKMNKKIFEDKLTLIIEAAKDYGEDIGNYDYQVPSGNKLYEICDGCTPSIYLNSGEDYGKVQISALISDGYIKSDDTSGIKNVSGSSINTIYIFYFKKNNRVNACIDSGYANDLDDDLTLSEFKHLGYYCEIR